MRELQREVEMQREEMARMFAERKRYREAHQDDPARNVAAQKPRANVVKDNRVD